MLEVFKVQMHFHTGYVGGIEGLDALYLLVMLEVFKVQMHCTDW